MTPPLADDSVGFTQGISSIAGAEGRIRRVLAVFGVGLGRGEEKAGEISALRSLLTHTLTSFIAAII